MKGAATSGDQGQRYLISVLACLAVVLLLVMANTPLAFAQESLLPKPAPSDKAADLADREKALKAEEDRILALRKEVEAKIARYEKLLADLEAAKQRMSEEESARIDRLVKLFEVMPPENAAVRLEALGNGMAATILGRMRERRASNVLAAMNPQKSAAVVRLIAGEKKKFPAQ